MDGPIEARVRILGLRSPFTENELRHAFREKAFQCHPDKGGDGKEFIRIKEAYDLLLENVPKYQEKDIKRTVEGALLTELGKGLGDLINSEDCKQCNAKGWTVVHHTEYIYEIPCPLCKGRGLIFGNRRNLFGFWFNEHICPICFGSGGIGRHPVLKILYHTCYHCRGTGQIEISNPVLPKNRVPNRWKNEDKRPKKKYCNQCGALLKADKCWRCQTDILEVRR